MTVSHGDNVLDLHSENNGFRDIKCFSVTPIHINDIRDIREGLKCARQLGDVFSLS